MVIDCRRAVAICKQCALIQESQQIEPTSERTNESGNRCPDLPELQADISLLHAKQKENEIRSRERLLLGANEFDRSWEKEVAFWRDVGNCLNPKEPLAERLAKFAEEVRKAFDDRIIYGDLLPKPIKFMRWPPKEKPPFLSLEELRLNGYQLPKDFEQYDRIYQAGRPKDKYENPAISLLAAYQRTRQSLRSGIQFRAKRSSDCSSMAAFTLASLSNSRARGSHESLTGWRAALRQTHWPRFKDRLLPDWE